MKSFEDLSFVETSWCKITPDYVFLSNFFRKIANMFVWSLRKISTFTKLCQISPYNKSISTSRSIKPLHFILINLTLRLFRFTSFFFWPFAGRTDAFRHKNNSKTSLLSLDMTNRRDFRSTPFAHPENFPHSLLRKNGKNLDPISAFSFCFRR